MASCTGRHHRAAATAVELCSGWHPSNERGAGTGSSFESDLTATATPHSPTLIVLAIYRCDDVPRLRSACQSPREYARVRQHLSVSHGARRVIRRSATDAVRRDIETPPFEKSARPEHLSHVDSQVCASGRVPHSGEAPSHSVGSFWVAD